MKIQQAEEAFTQAKQAFDDVTDNLYEELPALYDRLVWTSMILRETHHLIL